jgi:tetratricopeptide (TPR) repeat protein
MKQFLIAFFALVVPLQLFSQSVDELILNKKYKAALAKIDSRLEEKPEAHLYFKQALVYEAQSEFLLAAKSLEKALFYEPENAMYLAELGETYSNLGNLYQAVECFRRASEIAPGDLSLKGKLGRTYLNIDDFKRAFVTLSNLYQVDSTNVFFNKQLAFAAFKRGESSLSIRLYEKVVQDNPGDFGSRLNLIAVYKNKKNSAMVYQTGRNALTVFPSNATILVRTADGLFELKDYSRALSLYEAFLANHDSTYDVMKNYGISLYLTSQEEKSISILEKCFYQLPNDPLVCFYLGLAYKSLANYERSAEFMRAAIACAQPPYLSDMYHHLGQIYGRNREFEKSIAALQKAFEVNPEKVEVLFEIATTYEEFDFNKTLALNYYNEYLKTAGEKAKNADYALGRIQKIKEELFFDGK